MFIGTVVQMYQGKDTMYQGVLSNPNETIEEVAARAEVYTENARKANPNAQFRTLVGELTHEIEPPAPRKVKVRMVGKK